MFMLNFVFESLSKACKPFNNVNWTLCERTH